MVYLQATVRLYNGKSDEFAKLMLALQPKIKHLGWTLIGGYLFATGPQRSVVNLWQAPDADALIRLPGQIAEDHELSRIFTAVGACIESETYELLTKAPYSP